MTTKFLLKYRYEIKNLFSVDKKKNSITCCLQTFSFDEKNLSQQEKMYEMSTVHLIRLK